MHRSSEIPIQQCEPLLLLLLLLSYSCWISLLTSPSAHRRSSFGRCMNNRKRRGKTGPERFGEAWPISDWPFRVNRRKSEEGRRLSGSLRLIRGIK